MRDDHGYGAQQAATVGLALMVIVDAKNCTVWTSEDHTGNVVVPPGWTKRHFSAVHRAFYSLRELMGVVHFSDTNMNIAMIKHVRNVLGGGLGDTKQALDAVRLMG